MSATAIAWYKLKTNSALIASVPVANIKNDIVPTVYPGIGVGKISGNRQTNVSMVGNTLRTERVQVTVYCASKAQLTQILPLVDDALANAHGTVNGFTCESIVPNGEGPDIFDDVTLVYEQSADYMIRWHR
jgi:hypothetical protein